MYSAEDDIAHGLVILGFFLFIVLFCAFAAWADNKVEAWRARRKVKLRRVATFGGRTYVPDRRKNERTHSGPRT